MAKSLNGKRIAILATNGVEQSELTAPRKALEQAGAKTDLIAPEQSQIQGMNHREKGDTFRVDIPLSQAKPHDYDALLLPGGVANPDELRTYPEAVQFVRWFFDHHKPVAAICHGPWMLVEADVVRDRTLTSWPSLKTDIRNAGGRWVDRKVVHEGMLTTSRKPDDIPDFNSAMVESFGAEGALEYEARYSAGD
ncbi:MAG: type 1 glutamine amidotransferase [Deltaproteobacteria bacterium]|nr:type 1 glutamine amidotransferase [Deltaproteobacteria bacterium]